MKANDITGVLSSLKNQKKDVELMRKDTECGIAFEGWEDFHVGDKISCYEEKSERRTL
jgi:translation initiation factor IF-2